MNGIVQEQIGSYVGAFSELRKTAAGAYLQWLSKLRDDAFAKFVEQGFPTTRWEDWRFTNVSRIAQTEFRLAAKRKDDALRDALASHRIAGAACRLVFVNGHFDPGSSSVENLPPGVFAGGLAQQIAQQPQALEPHLGRYLDTGRDPFCALNTAFLDDGAWIRVRRGAIAEAPIHLLFISSADEGPRMNHPRNLLIVEESAEATVVEEFVSVGESPILCNVATELVAGESAVVSHYRIERESHGTFHISTLRMQQGTAANVTSHSVLLGGALVRNNVHPVLAGEGGECLINGLFLGRGREHLDNYMLVEHASPHCESRQFYNGILDQRAHGVFHGRIIVHKHAQKTDAKQTNRNLLLSDEAQIDTKPQLEIFADDVKCTHGATIGRIEENALFYLRTRGIDEPSARRLLLEAFAGECVDRMKEGPARAYAAALIREHVAQMTATDGAQTDGRQGQPEAEQERNGGEIQ